MIFCFLGLAEFIRILLSLCDLYNWVYGFIAAVVFFSSYLWNYDVVVEALIMGCAHHE